MMSWRRWIIFVLWFTAVFSVAGQTSNITQCISSYEWSLNLLQQTPCFVAANLESICTPTYVNSIPLGNHYVGPTFATANPCLCSSVTYSLISACGGCQNQTFIDWITWSANCTTSSFMTFPKPIPTSIVVPSWAYLDLTLTNDTFSVSAAQQNLTNTPTSISSSATTSSTSTVVSTLSTPSTTPSTTLSTSASVVQSHSNAGAIAGGVVGGLVFLAVIALVGLWFFMRRRRNMVQKDIFFDNRALVSGPSGSMSQTTKSMHGPSQSIYTSDMSTFPGSPLITTGALTTTIPPSRRSLESLSLSVAQLGGGSQGMGPTQGRYTGMPEV